MTWLPRRTHALLAAVAIAVPLVLLACSPQANAAPDHSATHKPTSHGATSHGATSPRATSHRATSHRATSHRVLWIVMENHSYSGIVGNAAAPYINKTLLPKGGNATNMHSETHPSLPNYLAMATGSPQGVADDKAPAAHPISGPSLFSQVDPSWRAYEDVMPTACRQTDTAFTANTNYAVRHNPPAYLVSPPIGSPKADCSTNDVPLGSAGSGALQKALAAGTLPRFSFVTPGICHDMHNAPASSVCNPFSPITAGDNWLKLWMPKIFASPNYTSGSLAVFITWDEGAGGANIKGMDCQSKQYRTDAGCHIPTLVFSKSTHGGSTSATYFDHYSMIRTAEELLGLSTTALGTHVSGAASMRTAFGL